MTIILAKLMGLFPLSWPEPLRKAAAWASIVAAVLALLWGAKAAYDASVIDKHEDQRAIESIEARDEAADQRAADAIKNTLEQKEMEDAINSVPADDAQLRADCLRLARVGIVAERCRRFGGD